MAENDMNSILNALKDIRWIPFLHSRTVALPLARFLANHGQLQRAIELLNAVTPPLEISLRTFDVLTENISSLDFACLTESENTRRRDPPKKEDTLLGFVEFL